MDLQGLLFVKAASTREEHRDHARLRRDAARVFASLWRTQYGRPLPDTWRPWPRVRRGIDSLARGRCWQNASSLRIARGLPMLVGFHVDALLLLHAMYGSLPPEGILPVGHAVNLDRAGRIIDITWGSDTTATGLFVGVATDPRESPWDLLCDVLGPRGFAWR